MTGYPFRDTLHVSASQVNAYLICPERFRLQYVECRPPSHRSGDLVFGSAVHGALAEYHRRLQANPVVPVPIDDLLQAFDRHMEEGQRGPVPVMWEDDDGPDKLRATGRGLLEMYAGSTGDADHSAGPNREPASEKGKAGGGGPTDDRNRLTAKQLKAIFAIGHVRRMTDGEIRQNSVKTFGCAPEYLSRSDASTYIDQLKAE